MDEKEKEEGGERGEEGKEKEKEKWKGAREKKETRPTLVDRVRESEGRDLSIKKPSMLMDRI